MKSISRWFGVLVGAALVLSASCDGCRPKPKFEQESAAEATKPDLPATGTITGTIKLAAGYDLPMYRPEDMERRVLAHIQGGTFPDVCTPPKQSDRTPVVQAPNGKLVGVMVAASEFSKSTPRGPKVHDLTIKDCRLSPRLVVGMLGDMLNLKNEVQFPFMPTYGANAYNETLTPGQSKAIRMDKAGVENVLCGFTAPCGRADVVVVRHPVFAVSDETGVFKIEDFPADETVRLSAWHPLFKDESFSVKVGRGESKNVEFVLTPMPPASPTPAPAADAGATKQ